MHSVFDNMELADCMLIKALNLHHYLATLVTRNLEKITYTHHLFYLQ